MIGRIRKVNVKRGSSSALSARSLRVDAGQPYHFTPIRGGFNKHFHEPIAPTPLYAWFFARQTVT